MRTGFELDFAPTSFNYVSKCKKSFLGNETGIGANLFKA